jgi:hypothetical protein
MYSHTTDVYLNSQPIGYTTIQEGKRTANFSVPPEALTSFVGGASANTLSLRSIHNNSAHYSVGGEFYLRFSHSAYTSQQCSVASAAPATTPDCAVGGGIIQEPKAPKLTLNLALDDVSLDPNNLQVGDLIPIAATVRNGGSADTTTLSDRIRIELTVPRGLVPRGMTIQGEEQTLLDEFLNGIGEFLKWLGLPFSTEFSNRLEVIGDNQEVTFIYAYTGNMAIGDTFPITLDVVGEVEGEFIISGRAILLTVTSQRMASSSDSEPNFQQITPTPEPAEDSLSLQVVLPTCTVMIRPDRDVFGYATSLEALLDSNVSGQNLRGFDNVVIDLRSVVNGNVVRARLRLDAENFSPYFWFFSGDGNVINTIEGDCNQLEVEVDDGSNYAIRIVSGSDGSSTNGWTAFEQREIILGVDEVARAFSSFSTVQPTTSVEAFNRVFQSVSDNYPSYVLIVRGNTLGDSLWRTPIPDNVVVNPSLCNDPNRGPATTVDGNDYCIPDVTVTFQVNDVWVTGIYRDINNGNCKAFEAQTVKVSDPAVFQRPSVDVFMPSAVVCNGTLLNGVVNTAQPVSPATGQASQHTIVHELGHIFDYLTKPTPGAVGDFTDRIDGGDFVLGGCNSIDTSRSSSTLMGFFGGEWTRGRRGWGSAPPFSMFLQSPESVLPSEAAADMFLNWVYRSNRDLTNYEDEEDTTVIRGYSTNGEIAPTSGCVALGNQTSGGGIVEAWLGGGFYNRRPTDNQAITTAQFDWSLSGNIRHVLMRDIMMSIFNTQGW